MNTIAFLNCHNQRRRFSFGATPLLKRLFLVALVATCIVAYPSIVAAVVIDFDPGDYDNTQNVVNAGPTPANLQTTGNFRDIFWWGSSNGLGAGDADFINSGKNLISNGGSPPRAVVGGDDNALNFTGVKIPNGGKNFLTIYDTTPGDTTLYGGVLGGLTKNLLDASGPAGLTVSADVLFAPGQHGASAGVVALYSENQDGLALLAHNGGNNNADIPKLSLVFQSPGIGTVLGSQNLPAISFEGDTNPGLSAAQALGSTSGDHWYRVIMNVKVNGNAWNVKGQFFNHSQPWDPNSALGAQIGIDLLVGGLLSDPDPAAGLDRVLTNPGQVGLMASVTEGFGDGISNNGGTPGNPLVDNVGVSITNFDPGIVPEPGALSLLALGGLTLLVRRRAK